MDRQTSYRMLLNRVIQFVRPRPRSIPLSVDGILSSSAGRSVVERFNDLYYSGGAARNLNWRGVEIIKNPCDLWMMVELLQRLRPSVLIETGTHLGGSALFYADIARTIEIDCTVVTIDYNPKWSLDPSTRGVTSLIGYSTDDRVLDQVREIVSRRSSPGSHVIATLDAGHSEEVVSAELELYAQLVTKDSYLIAEDTNINGHPSFASHGPGPWEAVERFLKTHENYIADEECQRFLLTFNPSGWLRRIA